jgi:hypothetical protein
MLNGNIIHLARSCCGGIDNRDAGARFAGGAIFWQSPTGCSVMLSRIGFYAH